MICPLPPPPSPVSELNRRHTGRLRKKDNLLTGERGRSKIIRRGERLVLYNILNTLWLRTDQRKKIERLDKIEGQTGMYNLNRRKSVFLHVLYRVKGVWTSYTVQCSMLATVQSCTVQSTTFVWTLDSSVCLSNNPHDIYSTTSDKRLFLDKNNCHTFLTCRSSIHMYK